ncbi:MAG: hypothetical protein IK115_03380 [Lachnospiraceae bacterium]|nr:hypothetical protein [Lachnospiraceae bacterium]
MLGILYIALCILSGKQIVERFAPGLRQSGTPAVFCVLPASFLAGTLALSWPCYFLAYLASTLGGSRHPLFFANLMVMPAAAVFIALCEFRRFRKEKASFSLPSVSGRFLLRCLPWLLLVCFVTGMCYRSFFVRDGIIHIGYSVFSDFATHLGMIRSFSYGNNFPTQYSHFGGEDIRYHFMFQFLAGNLEYLGLRLDHAFNIPSILSMLSACLLLFSYARKRTGSAAAAGLSVFFMIFHSSPSLFRWLSELPKGGFDLADFLYRKTFFSYTPKEDWGLWNYKVYLNQRHLAFGMAMVFLVLLLCDEAGRKTEGEKESLLRTALRGIFPGVLLGLTAFWNGAMVIGGLGVLFVFALFSKEKPKYLMLAVCALLLSLLQSAAFVRGSAVSPSVEFGFIAENPTFFGSLGYLLALSGVLLILAAAAFVCNARARVPVAAFSMPLIFGFFASLTPDITVNHKYLMLSFILLGIPVAGFITSLCTNRKPECDDEDPEKEKSGPVSIASYAAAAILLLLLTATGIYECRIVYNIDRDNLKFAREDALTLWVKENSCSQDLWLTDMYSNHASVLGGAMLYYGWPYYAWSAGYDTNGREAKVRQLFSEGDPQRMRKEMEEAGIRFVLVDDGLRFSADYLVREDVIASAFPCVFSYGDVAVYDVKGSK